MRVFATSDDGIMSPGYAALLEQLVRAGHAVVGAVPLQDTASTGTAVLPGALVAARPFVLRGATVHPWGGTASAAALAACDGMFGPPPEIVLVGVNHGPNVGTTALHSGTFGSALTALNAGRPAIAVSLDDVYATGGQEDGFLHWPAAATAGAALVPVIASLSAPVALNVNVPNVEPSAIRGARSASFARREEPGLRWREGEAGRRVDASSPYRPDRCPCGSDVALLAAGHVTISAVSGLTVVPGVAEAVSRSLGASGS